MEESFDKINKAARFLMASVAYIEKYNHEKQVEELIYSLGLRFWDEINKP